MSTHAETDRELELTDAIEAIKAEVGSWEGVTVGRHSRGGDEFHLGRRNLGHLHDGFPVAHIPLPKRVRDEMIAAGRGEPHPVMPDSGWIGIPMRTDTEVTTTIEVFRIAYDRAQEAAERR